MIVDQNDIKFPCTACGKCCRKVGHSLQTQFLDRGDSVCRYLDEQTNFCQIYQDRPLVCRVEEYYKKYYLENKEKLNEYKKKYNLENKEKLKEYRKKYN